MQRDIVVVAASAGGVESLRALMGALPAGLPAAVLTVLHVAPRGGSVLHQILDRVSPLKVVPAEDGRPVEHGHVYVARPDHHLLVRDGMTRLSRGPRYNGHRPAADPLFMSAALEAGPRVMAVVLSGTLDDGARGCEAVARYGGVVAVQTPGEAAFPSMPMAARAAVPEAVPLPVPELAKWIVQQSRTPVDMEDRVRDRGMEQEVAQFLRETPPPEPDGGLIALSCPECGGPMYERKDGASPAYVCRVGHTWSSGGMIGAQSGAVERALWVALQRLEERLLLLDRMLKSSKEGGRRLSHQYLQEEAVRTREALGTIRVLQSRVGRGDDSLLTP